MNFGPPSPDPPRLRSRLLCRLLPGSAHVLSSFLSYIVEKRLSKNPEEFGTRPHRGVAGPETANNAATGGAMVPFLALGIPTGPAIAVMMIALLIHGVRPGPCLFPSNLNSSGL